MNPHGPVCVPDFPNAFVYKSSPLIAFIWFGTQTEFFFFVARQPLFGQGLFISEASRSYSDTPLSAGLFSTSDQPGSETFT